MENSGRHVMQRKVTPRPMFASTGGFVSTGLIRDYCRLTGS